MIFKALYMLLIAAEDGCRFIEADGNAMGRSPEERAFAGKVKDLICAVVVRLPMRAWEKGEDGMESFLKFRMEAK